MALINRRLSRSPALILLLQTPLQRQLTPEMVRHKTSLQYRRSAFNPELHERPVINDDGRSVKATVGR